MRVARLTLALFLMLVLNNPFFLEAQQDEEKTEEQNEETSSESRPDYLVVVEDRLPSGEKVSTSATKTAVPLQELPASVDVVPRSVFEVQNATFLGEALKNVSGINVQPGFGVFDQFVIRGFDSLSNALILTDGAPEPESTLYQLYNVDRVEVLKGPGAFLYGGNPLSGTINLVRKQPLFNSAFNAHTSFGTFESYRGVLDWNTRITEDAAFRLNGMWQASDNYRDNKDGDQFAINPAVTWRVDDSSYLNVNFEFLSNDFQPDSGVPIFNGQIADVPRTNSYQSSIDTSKQDIYRLRADYERQINENLTLRNKFYYTDLEWISQGTLINGAFPVPGAGTLVFRSLPLLEDRQKLFGNQFEAIFSLQTGSIEHKLLTGFEISRLDDDFTFDVAMLDPVPLDNPVDRTGGNLTLIPGQSIAGDSTSVVLAPYIIDQISLSPQFKLFIGGRLDNVDYEDRLIGTDRDDTKFSPLAGITYLPVKDLSIYFNAGQAFAPPSSLTVGERVPEESTQYEAGIKKQFLNGKLSSSFAVYRIEKENIAIPDDNGITRQTGDQLSKGFEVELGLTGVDQFNAFFNYAFNDSELTSFSEIVFTPVGPIVFDRSGNTSAFAPEHILNLWLMKEFDNGFGIAGGPRYVSSQFIAEDNAFKMDSYTTVDASVFYDIKAWRFSVNFKNLTDTDYETRGFGPFAVIPANPFAVYCGVDFRL